MARARLTSKPKVIGSLCTFDILCHHCYPSFQAPRDVPLIVVDT